MPDPSDKKARSKAFQIRRKLPRGAALPGEVEWLTDYEKAMKGGAAKNGHKATSARLVDAQTAPPDPPPAPSSFAAGSSKKIMHVEEHTQAVQASGDPAVMAEMLKASTAREEGRRYDYLLDAAVGSLRFVVDELMKEKKELQKTQISMMEAIREQYVARTQAEINTMFAAADAKKAAEESASGTDEQKAMKFMEQLATMMPMIQSFMGAKAATPPPKT